MSFGGTRRSRPAWCGRGVRRSAAIASAILAVLGFVAASAGVARAADDAKKEKKAPAYKVEDANLVYLGNPRLFKKPCAVTTDTVYKAIPEYKEVVDKGLTEKDVRYHFLMKKASDKFSRAIREVAREGGYDLVAAKGAVVPANTDTPAVPDSTDAAIKKLPTE